MDDQAVETTARLGRRFSQWAEAAGRVPTGHIVVREIRVPDRAARTALHLDEGVETVCTVRLRTLDGQPTYVERAYYGLRVARAVLEMDLDCPSITSQIYEPLGIYMASSWHVIDTVPADDLDAELLGITAGDLLMRRCGTTVQADGTPIDYCEDRYLPDSVSFRVHNSASSTATSRTFRAEWRD